MRCFLDGAGGGNLSQTKEHAALTFNWKVLCHLTCLKHILHSVYFSALPETFRQLLPSLVTNPASLRLSGYSVTPLSCHLWDFQRLPAFTQDFGNLVNSHFLLLVTQSSLPKGLIPWDELCDIMEKISYLIHAYPCSRLGAGTMCGPDPHWTSNVQPSIVGPESIPTE